MRSLPSWFSHINGRETVPPHDTRFKAGCTEDLRPLEGQRRLASALGPALAERYEEAHRQLIHHEGNPRTVTEIATGLGFVHLSRFAGSYRQLYGETPAATLRAAN